MPADTFDYVVVGSGAGGGTVAARLAEAGYTVCVLEAGGDPRALEGGNALRDTNCLPEDYDVPAFHACSTENEAIAWNYFVRHYDDDRQQRRDVNCWPADPRQPIQGVLYPRAGTLGGCTAHNAMILVYPDNEDWDRIARETGDSSWSAEAMRRVFERLERCRHQPLERLRGEHSRSRHGFHGWLPTEKALPLEALQDEAFARVLARVVFWAALRSGGVFHAVKQLVNLRLDPNDWRRATRRQQGLYYTPLTTLGGRRYGTRERLRDVQHRFPERLEIRLDTHATGIAFDGTRAVGVHCWRGKRLYRAFAKPGSAVEEKSTVYARQEVIVSAGTFNTPQLLMLSGIGPRAELARHGIAPRQVLEGVGANLQDRYEVGITYELRADWRMLDGASFCRDDPQFAAWSRTGGGVYATNGAVLSVIRRSSSRHRTPDLFCFALLGTFGGYRPGWSRSVAQQNRLTWAVLKGHTNNRAGSVRLASADPLAPPDIRFRYFEEGSEGWQDDLDGVVSGVRFVRSVMRRLVRKHLVLGEAGTAVHAMSDRQLADFVRDNAWGHHACGTCAIGRREEGGVVDARFRVHGVDGLRIVDASIFPRIPGLFIASAVYVIGEKAAGSILDDAPRR